MGGEVYPKMEFKPTLQLGTTDYLFSGKHEKFTVF